MMFPFWWLPAKKKTPLQQLSQKSLKFMSGAECGNLTCPSITVGEQQIRVNDNPQLLDVILDCSLSLNAHVKHIKQSPSLRLWAITVTEHASWDWQKPSLQTAFHILVCSELGYTAPAWLHCTSMATLAFQHHYHQFGLSPKLGSMFDNQATSFYSIWNPLSWIQHSKLLYWKQTYDCSSQGEMSQD